jgi:hypothetical protein
MSQEPEDPASLVIKVFWAIAGLFALMIVGGAVLAIANGFKSNNQLSPQDKQIETSPITTPHSGSKP